MVDHLRARVEHIVDREDLPRLGEDERESFINNLCSVLRSECYGGGMHIEDVPRKDLVEMAGDADGNIPSWDIEDARPYPESRKIMQHSTNPELFDVLFNANKEVHTRFVDITIKRQKSTKPCTSDDSENEGPNQFQGWKIALWMGRKSGYLAEGSDKGSGDKKTAYDNLRNDVAMKEKSGREGLSRGRKDVLIQEKLDEGWEFKKGSPSPYDLTRR